MRGWPRSLQGRLVLLVGASVALVWALAAAATWRDVKHELDELLDGHLAQAAALLIVQQSGDFEAGEHEAAEAPTLHRYAPKVAFEVRHEGLLALRSSNAPDFARGAPGFSEGFRTMTIDGADWRVFAARGARRDVQVYVSERQSSRSDILWAVLRSTLWPMLLAWPLLVAAAWWAIRSGTRPLRSLGRTLSARQPQALQPVTVAHAPSEMVPLLAALNGLFERIAAQIDAERRFTADAAHELRTPVAAVRAQAQVALAEAEPAARNHALHAVIEGCDRASRLVDQLLTLARVEAGDGPALGPVDLLPLAQRIVSEAAPAALAKGQAIELDAPAPCSVTGDATLLAALLRNLVDNAIRYSPPGARVCVSLRVRGAQVMVVVADSGAGLSDAQLARLGERFYRVLGSGQAGSGLGWSIVRRIAAVHGISVTAARSAGLGGLEVTLAWPPAAASSAVTSM